MPAKGDWGIMATNVFKQNLSKLAAIERHNRHEITTLAQLHDEFIFELEGNHRTAETIKTYEKHFNKVFEFCGYMSLEDQDIDYETTRDECRRLGRQVNVKDLNVPQLGSYFHKYLEEVCYPPLSEQTIISCMRNFRVIMYYAMEKKLIPKFSISVKNVEPPIKQTFLTDEIYALTHKKPVKEDFINYRNWVMVQYLMATGNRIGSVLALNVEDIDFENNEIHIQYTKSRRPQIAALPSKLKPHLIRWIKDYRCDSDGVPLYMEPLFCNVFGQRLASKSASDSMAEYFAARRVKWDGFHKFRHTYAAHWIRDGGDSLELKTQLGHSSLAMTNRYANLYGKAVAKSVEEHSLINKVRITSGRKRIDKKE